MSPSIVRLLVVTMLTAVMGILAGCSAQLPSEKAPMKVSAPGEGYLLEPGNRVRVVVFNEANVSGDFTIDSAGNLAMPLVGNIPAAGVTASRLAERIHDSLTKQSYLRDPQVSVEVQTFRPFYVMGEVRAPGEFPYTAGLTVLSGIARAGGYDYRAREGDVILVRTINGEQREYAASEQTPLQPGDIIRVLERHF